MFPNSESKFTYRKRSGGTGGGGGGSETHPHEKIVTCSGEYAGPDSMLRIRGEEHINKCHVQFGNTSISIV
jgi:hypothetical protein